MSSGLSRWRRHRRRQWVRRPAAPPGRRFPVTARAPRKPNLPRTHRLALGKKEFVHQRLLGNGEYDHSAAAEDEDDGGGSGGARRPEALTGGAGMAAAHGARVGDRCGVLGRGAREARGRGRGGQAGARHVRHVPRALVNLGTPSQVALDFSHLWG